MKKKKDVINDEYYKKEERLINDLYSTWEEKCYQVQVEPNNNAHIENNKSQVVALISCFIVGSLFKFIKMIKVYLKNKNFVDFNNSKKIVTRR